MLPLWKTLPIIGPLAVLLKRLFSGAKKRAERIKDPSDLVSGFTKSHTSQPAVSKRKMKISENNAVETYIVMPFKPVPSSGWAKTSKEQLA